jgi:DNA polymerase-3 subunit gamma/tau
LQPSFEPQTESHIDKGVACEISDNIDLKVVWNEIVSEIMQRHPLTAQSLKKALIEVLGDLSLQLTVVDKFNYDGVMEFKEQILELFKRKTGLNIAIKVGIEKNISSAPDTEDIIAKKEKDTAIVDVAKENFNEPPKSAIPKHIEEIAKKFGSTAKKL